MSSSRSRSGPIIKDGSLGTSQRPKSESAASTASDTLQPTQPVTNTNALARVARIHVPVPRQLHPDNYTQTITQSYRRND